MLILRFLYRVRPQCGDTSAMYKSRSLCSAHQVLRPIKAASVSGRLEWPPTTFCWVSSLLPCQSARRKPCRQPQPKVQCPAFPIAKKVHEGFSCDHLLSVKLVVICWILPPKERTLIDNHTVIFNMFLIIYFCLNTPYWFIKGFQRHTYNFYGTLYPSWRKYLYCQKYI